MQSQFHVPPHPAHCYPRHVSASQDDADQQACDEVSGHSGQIFWGCRIPWLLQDAPGCRQGSEGELGRYCASWLLGWAVLCFLLYPHTVVTPPLSPRAQEEAGRRDVLGLLGLIAGLSAAQASQAADAYEVSAFGQAGMPCHPAWGSTLPTSSGATTLPLILSTHPHAHVQEMRALSAARTGGSSLLESFQGTKGAMSGGKTSRGIREKLAAEAAPAKKSGGFSFGGGSPKPASSAVAAAPKTGPKLSFSSPSLPKPAAPKPAAAAGGSSASGSGASLETGPLLQAAGVLGVVGVGASVATSAATSKVRHTSTHADTCILMSFGSLLQATCRMLPLTVPHIDAAHRVEAWRGQPNMPLPCMWPVLCVSCAAQEQACCICTAFSRRHPSCWRHRQGPVSPIPLRHGQGSGRRSCSPLPFRHRQGPGWRSCSRCKVCNWQGVCGSLLHTCTRRQGVPALHSQPQVSHRQDQGWCSSCSSLWQHCEGGCQAGECMCV